MAAALDSPQFTRYVVHTRCIPDPRQLFWAVSQQVYANGGKFEIEVGTRKT